MSATQTLLHELQKIGHSGVVKNEPMEEVQFILSVKPPQTGPKSVRCRVTVKTIDGLERATIQLRSRPLAGYVNHTRLDHTFDRVSYRYPFGSLQARGNHMMGEFEFYIFLTYTILLDDISEISIGAILQGMTNGMKAATAIALNEMKVESISRKRAELKVAKEALHAEKVEAHRAYVSKNLYELRQRRLGESIGKLEKLVGLAPVKTLVNQLVAQQQINHKRIAAGLKPVILSPHLVFTGNPGTGKTTVAKLVGEIYKRIGILPKGHVVETDRSGLVAAYLGQTALKTKEVCERALGGVLFIDEAYSLAVDHRDYGYEAIEALLTFMEENRGKLAVVVAGYPERMEKFLASNPGLRSRFDMTLSFGDYSNDEMLEIFQRLVAENEFSITETALADVKCAIENIPRNDTFANARDVRQLFNAIVAEQALQLTKIPNPTVHQLSLLTSFCIPASLVPQHEISLADLPPIQ